MIKLGWQIKRSHEMRHLGDHAASLGRVRHTLDILAGSNRLDLLPKVMVSKLKRQTLEELFELPEDYLHGPIAEALRPGVIDATERTTGRDRVLKIWKKTGTPSDAELRELWRHERLQVDRIMCYPGAADVMVGVVGMIETDDAFCIIHEPGMVPLAAKLRSANRQYWMLSLNVPANRITLWSNLARLVRALGTIHAQGLIHGRIDTFAIFTEGGSSPDFRLGGFEWSLVIGEARPMPASLQQIRARIQQLIYSFAEDWKSLATVFATFVGLDPKRLFPDSPIVFVDMPFVSRTGNARPVESGRPRWHNPAEARMVTDLVAHLELTTANPEELPSLAILSPYWAQVERISRQIEALRAQGGLGFTKFEGFAHGNRVCGTVDSSQGSEADLVIVSLVRNNHWTGVPALGFLRDRRRMNVLLSRARQQLIILGSIEFLKEASRYAKENDELSFVVKFLREIERLRHENAVRGIAKVCVIAAGEVARLIA